MSDDPNPEFPDLPSLDPAKVERAVRRLPFLEREALRLKSRGRMTYAEIGAVLGLTPAQAEARVASALVKLHSRLMRPQRTWRRRWTCRRRTDG